MSDLKGLLPIDRAVSTFFSWIGKWVVRDSNMSQKDNDGLRAQEKHHLRTEERL